MQSDFDVSRYDAVVIGSGVAGLRAAAELGDLRTAVISPDPPGYGSASRRATGGIAAAVGSEDSPRLHARDTLEAGAGLCAPDVVEMLTREAPGQVEELENLGVGLDRDDGGELALGREAAHSRRRIVLADRDQGGVSLVEALFEQVAERKTRVDLLRGEVVELSRADGRLQGVLYEDAQGVLRGAAAPAVVLASGGLGGLYRRTTNPRESVGRGLALAYRAGATLADLEFVQFHPTALDSGDGPLPLFSEVLRGEGARLVDAAGRPVLEEYDEATEDELTSRDVVARAIWTHRREEGEVFLDVGPVERFAERFPAAARAADEAGIDSERRLPVTPAAHYHMGGVEVDLEGRTDCPGLWACGEVADTGAHGANRLASNSMLECLVLGRRAGESVRNSEAIHRAARRESIREALQRRRESTTGPPEGDPSAAVPEVVRRSMWRGVGVVRDAWSLSRVSRLLRRARRGLFPGTRARDAALVAELVARSALRRDESRGAHHRRDAPTPRGDLRGRLLVRAPETAEEESRLGRTRAARWDFRPLEAEN